MPGLTIVGYEHGIAYGHGPAALQRIAAVADASDPGAALAAS